MNASVPCLRVFAGPNGSGKAPSRKCCLSLRSFEVTGGEEIEVKTDLIPVWFKTALWDKFGESEPLV